MQLHACLLLFLITTDNIVAWSDQHCGGNVSLDQKPSGHIKLSLPGLFNDTSTLLNPMNHQSNKTSQPLNCTWVLDIPSERTVLLKLVWLEGVSRISLRCEEDLALQSGDTALLFSCDRNKATLSWTGAGRSSDSLQLVYYVQENERNSSEVHSTPNPTGGSQTGTTIKNITVAEEVVRGTKEGRGRLYEELVWRFGPQFVSSTSSRDEGPLPSTSPQQGLPVSGRADRETLSLPEEKTNNGADTSGASHLIDDPMSARTSPYFQHSVKSQTENPTLTQTEMSWTDAKVTAFGADLHKFIRKDQRLPSSSALPITSPSEIPTLESSTNPYPHDGVKLQDEKALSWTSQENTDKFNSDLTSATSSNPLKPSTKHQQHDSSSANTEIQPTLSSSSSSHGFSRTHSPHTHITEPDTSVATVEAASVHPHTNQSDSFLSDVRTQTAASESSDEKLENTADLHTFALSTQSQTHSPESTERLVNATSSLLPQTVRETTNTIPSSPDKDDGQTSSFTGFFSTPGTGHRKKIQSSTAASRATYASPFTHAVLQDNSPTDLTISDSSTPSYTTQTHSEFPDTTLTSFAVESSMHTTFVDQQTNATHSQTSHSSNTHNPPSSTNIPTYKQSHESITASTFKNDKFWQWFPTRTTKQPPTSGPNLHPSQQNHLDLTPSAFTPTPSWRSTSSPLFYIVPNQAATIRVEMIELLLQIVVEDSRLASSPGLEEDAAAWVHPYLQRAPGFIKLLGVWSSGRAVQSLVVFKTSAALQWLSASEPTSLLEQTGLAQAVHEGKMFRSSKITNITLGGLQGDVCDWLLQCPAGYKCIPEPGTTNHSCSSLCRFDYCHHHGICTHHPGQLPVCRCLVGDDFWYMGQRCDMRMTRMRLVGACLAILLIIATVIGILAFVAVRRYRAILIQAKVDQTRSSYRRFNHFDELSGRFWLRSWAGSADSLDNPVFTRSDELLHLRALDRPCCYHDDTLSLSSTCPSHGARLNTIYPHSSQYGWRGSEMSMGDGVLDSGKASDLSVCSWPVEPIHWTPFPLLQQLASHRTPTVRVSRPRSYCEGMELVDLGKSWTA